MKKWTEKEKAYLLEAKQAGKTFAEIAKTLKRSHKSIEHKYYSLKALKRGDIRQIIKDIEKGASYQEILMKYKIKSTELFEILNNGYTPPKNFLTERPKCKQCGRIIAANSPKFPDYCSLKCWALDDK